MVAGYIFLLLTPTLIIKGQSFLPKTPPNPLGKIFVDYVKPGPLAYSVRYNMDPTPNEVKFVDIKIDLMYVEILKASVNKAYCYLVFKTLGALLSQAYDISRYTFEPKGKASWDSLRRVENYLGSVFAKHKVQSDALTMVNYIVAAPIQDELAKGSSMTPKFFERLSQEIVTNFDFIVSVVVNTLISLDSNPGHLLVREFDTFMTSLNVSRISNIERVVHQLKQKEKHLVLVLNYLFNSSSSSLLMDVSGQVAYKYDNKRVYIFGQSLANQLSTVALKDDNLLKDSCPDAEFYTVAYASGMLAPQSVLVSTTLEFFMAQQFRLTANLVRSVFKGQQKAVNESTVPISINPLQYQMLMRTIYQQLAHIMYDALTEKFQQAMDVNKWPLTAKVADTVNADVFAMLLSAVGNFMTEVQAQEKLQSIIVKSISYKVSILIQVRNDVTGKERDYFTVQEWEELRNSVGLELASKQEIIDMVTNSFRNNVKGQWGANLCAGLQALMSKVGDADALKQNLIGYGKTTLGIPGKYFDVLYQVFGNVLDGTKSAAAAKGHKNWRSIFG